MRTTITLRDDVFRAAKIKAAQTGKTLSAVVEEALLSGAPKPDKPFELIVSSVSGPLREGLSYDRIAEILDYLDEVDAGASTE